ncbi:MAG TPA: dynamin family protein [Allocoleopsis sp.]
MYTGSQTKRMQSPPTEQDLLTSLKAAVGLVDLEPNSPLKQDVLAVCDRLTSPDFRIAVFGPFNYGKSTLLNAFLGEKALPIDLIPTTGAAIRVKYGSELSARILLNNGSEISEAGTDILKRFAILDDQRRMREDVTAVEVYCPHPFLQTGVELLDLPGTNDREAQDALVKDQLLTADLVVQVLDGRKLMTLGERENLRDWLLDRGIATVVFVVNFLNLMKPDDQKEVYRRMRFVAESFRSHLPPGVSNLYRVDALPALRSRLKGDMAAAQTAGLPMFESALQSIVQAQRGQTEPRLPRVVVLANQVQQALQAKRDAIAQEISTAEQTRNKKGEIRQKAQKLIKDGFAASAAQRRDWLSLTNLLDRYQTSTADALQRLDFTTWETNTLKPAWNEQKRSLAEWVYKACDFLNCPRPADLWFAFPEAPQVLLPPEPPATKNSSSSNDATPVAIATGLGWVLGGPLGAAVLGGASYLLNQTTDTPTSTPPTSSAAYTAQVQQACNDAARDYLTRFSALALAALRDYELTTEPILNFPIPTEQLELSHQRHQLQLIDTTLENLTQALKLESG